MITPCPNANENCKYFGRSPLPQLRGAENGCFADTDHIVPQRFRTLGSLIRLYIDTPDNKQQLCRSTHDEKREYYDDIPEDEVMYDAVMRAAKDGKLRLNRRDREGLQKYGE